MIRLQYSTKDPSIINFPQPPSIEQKKPPDSRFFKRIDAAPVVEATVDDKDTTLTGEGIFVRSKNTRRVWDGFPPMVV